MDADYFIQQIHNCFKRDTRFITKDGIKSFEDFEDGDKVIVKDKLGEWKEATVHSYGIQSLQKVVLVNDMTKQQVTITCTKDHRWILSTGRVTTDLAKGHALFPNGHWSVYDIKSLNKKEVVWCVEEPTTQSFTLEHDIVTGNCCLVNLEDMLQNGTVISETMIDPPKSFSTAATVASQIAAQISSSQWQNAR